MPKVGLGTWLMGGNMEANSSDDEVCLRAIQSALDLGYRHIDTAELYGNGHAEELVGQAITNTKRENLIIATKVAKTNLQYEDVLKAAKGSLKRLKLDYVDIYYIHAPNPNIPVEGTMKAMNKLIKEGLIKNIAVSNFTIDMIREAQSFADTKIVANQVEYSLSTQLEDNYGYSKNVCSEMVPYCQENGIMLVAYRPVNRGELLEPNKILDKVAQKYGKTRAQIAINWLVSQKNVVTIPMSQNETHLKENLEAGDWEMDPEDIEALGVAYR